MCLLQRDGPNGLLWLSVPKVLSQHTASGERANLVALIWPAASSATWLEDRSYRTASGQPGRCACRAIRSPLEGFWVAAPTTEARNILRRGQANRARVRPPAASGSRRFALDVSGSSHQPASYGDQGQDQSRGGHKVKKAINAEASHHACANQWADDGAQTTNKDEPTLLPLDLSKPVIGAWRLSCASEANALWPRPAQAASRGASMSRPRPRRLRIR